MEKQKNYNIYDDGGVWNGMSTTISGFFCFLFRKRHLFKVSICFRFTSWLRRRNKTIRANRCEIPTRSRSSRRVTPNVHELKRETREFSDPIRSAVTSLRGFPRKISSISELVKKKPSNVTKLSRLIFTKKPSFIRTKLR